MVKKVSWRKNWIRFADLEEEGGKWITSTGVDFYPDYLAAATNMYSASFNAFGRLIQSAGSSIELLRAIFSEPSDQRKVLLRIFRRYVSPESPVELIKRANDLEKNMKNFSSSFRKIEDVRTVFRGRPIPDEALSGILFEHQNRGKPGTELTNAFFAWVSKNLHGVNVRGGKDIQLNTIFLGYPKTRGVDFLISDADDNEMLAIGFLHYDSDRGGAQESDRTGNYRDAAEEIVPYLQRGGNATKLLFINDGPGLLAGKMWRMYADIEALWKHRIQVNTLKMLPHRLTLDWLLS
jgi:hypothetical protein